MYSEGLFDKFVEPLEFDMRSYQDASIEELRAGIRGEKTNQVLCSPTGSGKSVLAAFLLKECHGKGRRGLFIAERITLINQFSAMLDAYGIPHGCIQAGHPRTLPGELIQVASAQTLARRGFPAAELILVDECHIGMRVVIRHIAQKKCPAIGLTATPFAKGMGKTWEHVVNVTTTDKLTADGFLVPFKVWCAVEPDMTGAKVTAGEWQDDEAGERATKIVGDVVKEYQRLAPGEKFIAFGCTVAHCEELQRQFLRAGIRAELYTYREDDESKLEHMKEFRKANSSILGLISVSALSRGLDVPDVTTVIACRPLKSSLAEHIQILGRALRPYPGKEFAKVIDCAGNCARHWGAMMEFFAEGVSQLDDGKPKPKTANEKKERKPVKCPRCSHVFTGGSHCPSCGYIFPPKKSIEHEAGELRQFDGAGILKMDKAAKTKLYGELLSIAIERRYKPGWIAHKYRAVTGVWPHGVETDPIKPSEATLQFIDAERRRREWHKTVSRKSQEVDLFA